MSKAAIPKDFRFVIFGKIIHTDYFVRKLNEDGFPKPLVIVSLDEEYHRDERLLTPHGLYSDIEKLAQDGLCDLYKMKTINCHETIVLLDRYEANIAISINCRNIIKKNIINYFGGNIFNLHDSYLPNERGGALNTWRILNGINEVGNTVHFLNEGIDTGSIVAQRKVEINKEFPESIDYLLAEKNNCEKILSQFINLVKSSTSVPSNEQVNNDSYYFPRLFTEVNGVINWDWDIQSIEKFIRAFASPYPGAFSYFRDKKVHILKCVIENDSKRFHPFSNGKIVTIMDNKDVRVIAGGQALIIKEISIDDTVVRPGDILSIKYSFASPAEELANAKAHIPTTLSMNKKEVKYNESI